LYIISIFFRYPNGDEGLQAEHIYFLNKLGFVRSDIWAGYEFGWDVRQYHYHKGIVLLGSLATKVFGFSLPALRIVSVIFYLWFVTILYKYFSSAERQEKGLFYLVLGVLLVNTVFYEYTFIFRPEVMMMTLGFASYYYIDKGLKKTSWKYIALAGIFAGLAALMHLIGLTLMAAGGITLLFKKRIKYVIIFSVFSLVALGIYFWDLLSREAFDGFIHQFFNEASIANKQESPFGKILEEHIRFFNSPKEILFSVLFFLSLGLNFNYLKKHYNTFLIYGIASIVALAFLAPNPTNKYALMYYPFMALTIALSLYRIKEYKRPLQIIFMFLLVTFSVYHLQRTYQFLSVGVNIAKHNQEIVSLLPEKQDVNVFAAESFVFNEIENYTIHSWLAFHRYYTKRKPGYNPDKEDFVRFCENLDDRYIIFDKKLFKSSMFHYIDDKENSIGDMWGVYTIIVNQPELLILENTDHTGNLVSKN
jgi:hypothetical protein